MMHTNVKLDRNIEVAVLTVSDTRNYETDKGGQLIQTLLKDENVNIKKENYHIVKDDQEAIYSQLQTWLQQNILMSL